MKKLMIGAVGTLVLAGVAIASDWKPDPGAHYEIYLCAGQSNMDGRAKAVDLTEVLAPYAAPQADVLIRSSSGGLRRKHRVSDGIITLRPGCSESPLCFGPELAFGRAMADARRGKKILLIKVAEGGSSLFLDWNPDYAKKLYAQMMLFTRHTQELLKAQGATSEIAGMIWMQGESDSVKNQTDKYQERLTSFIARVRADLQVPNLPFVIGQICAANPSYKEIIAAQKAVARSVPATGFASSAGLKTSDKNVHFDARSQIELGKRFAAELLKLSK